MSAAIQTKHPSGWSSSLESARWKNASTPCITLPPGNPTYNFIRCCPMNVLRTTFCSIALPLSLSACMMQSALIKQAPLPEIGLPSQDALQLKGELPPNFSLYALAHYEPESKMNCIEQYVMGFAFYKVHEQKFKQDFSKLPQSFNFSIPSTYKFDRCTLSLKNINLFSFGQYHEDKTATSDIILDTTTSPPRDAPKFDTTGVLSINNECTWSFYIQGQTTLDKGLFCNIEQIHIPKNKIQSGTIAIVYKMAPQEIPLQPDNWVAVKGGWRRCLSTDDPQICRGKQPEEFFLLDGHICTIYPGCTE